MSRLTPTFATAATLLLAAPWALGASSCVDEAAVYQPFLDAPYLVGSAIPDAIPIENQVATYYGNVPYGPLPDQALDALIPPSPDPTPALVYFGGNNHFDLDRTRTWSERGEGAVRDLGSGMAWFNIGITPLTLGAETVGVSRQLQEGRRALRFITLHAESFNIDPTRIAVLGDSSGAGIAFWLAIWGATGDPLDPDPLMRVDATVRAAALRRPPASWDPRSWGSIFAPLALSIDGMRVADAITQQQLTGLFGATGIDVLVSESAQIYASWDGLRMAEAFRPDVGTTPNDALPAIYVSHPATSIGFPQSFTDLLHHPYHVRHIVQQAASYGANVQVIAPVLALDTRAPGNEDERAFLIQQLSP